jgi:hypothetical protein
MAKIYSKEQEMHCAYIKHFRDEFRKRGILFGAYARALGISKQWLYNICNYQKEGLPVPSVRALKTYRAKLDGLLESHNLEEKDTDITLFT